MRKIWNRITNYIKYLIKGKKVFIDNNPINHSDEAERDRRFVEKIKTLNFNMSGAKPKSDGINWDNVPIDKVDNPYGDKTAIRDYKASLRGSAREAQVRNSGWQDTFDAALHNRLPENI
jgi:hypothetical protein